MSAFDLSGEPAPLNRPTQRQRIAFIRASMVLLVLSFAGCETISIKAPPSTRAFQNLNETEVRFVLQELTTRPTSPVSGVALFSAELAQAFGIVESQTVDPDALQKLDTDALTINNPTYWQAVLEMGKDRVLLFWLRGLLLTLENKPGEALEWNLFVRQSVFLSDDLDAKWGNWERHLIEKLSDDTRITLENQSRSGSRFPGLVRMEVVGDDGRIHQVGVIVPPSIELLDRSILPPSAFGYEPFFQQRFQEEGLHPRIRDAMKKTWVPWPYESLLAPDELILCATWYGHHQAHDFALVSYMGAGDRADLREDAVTKTLLTSQLGADRASTILEAASQFPNTFSQNYIGSIPTPLVDRPINLHLQKQLIQTSRRLEGISLEIKEWSINRDQFHAYLARHYQLLGQAPQMRRIVDLLVKQNRRASITKTSQLQLAILEGNQADIIATLDSLQKSDHKMKRTALAQAQGALALGKWHQAAEAFETGARASAKESQFERAHYGTLHAHICHQLSGSTSSTNLATAFAPIDDSVWVNQLRLTLLGELARESLLELAQVDSDFETAGRQCEAYLVLAFIPDQTEAGRRSNLRACINTGRVDFIEYQMAQSILRQLEAGKRP